MEARPLTSSNQGCSLRKNFNVAIRHIYNKQSIVKHIISIIFFVNVIALHQSPLPRPEKRKV